MGRGRAAYAPPGVEQAAQVLANACLFAAVLTGATAVMPFSATAPRGLAVVLTVLGLALAAGLRRLGARTPAALLHGVLALASVLVSTCIAMSTTPAGTVVTAFGYLWLALYTAFFHSGRQVAAHLALMGAGFAVGLVACGAPSPLQTWGFVAASVGGVALTLARLVERLRLLAEHDALTGLLTRGSFTSAADRVLAHAARRGEPVTLVLIDLDDFKRVNDVEGHLRGDELLAGLARDWTGVLRRSDLLGRYGGDEFVLLVPGDRPAAEDVLARMRAATPSGRWSAGVAQWQGEDLDDWLRRADAELYAVKRRRRDLVR